MWKEKEQQVHKCLRWRSSSCTEMFVQHQVCLATLTMVCSKTQPNWEPEIVEAVLLSILLKTFDDVSSTMKTNGSTIPRNVKINPTIMSMKHNKAYRRSAIYWIQLCWPWILCCINQEHIDVEICQVRLKFRAFD